MAGLGGIGRIVFVGPLLLASGSRLGSTVKIDPLPASVPVPLTAVWTMLLLFLVSVPLFVKSGAVVAAVFPATIVLWIVTCPPKVLKTPPVSPCDVFPATVLEIRSMVPRL